MKQHGVVIAKRESSHRKQKTETPDTATSTLKYMEAYLSMLLKDAVKNLDGCYHKADYTRDLHTLKTRVMSEGIGFVTKTLPGLGTGLIQLAANQPASFPQFRTTRGMVYPTFLGRLFRLALEESNTLVRHTAFNILYSITVAFKKLKGPYKKRVLVKQFTDFVDTDKELANLDLFSNEAVFSILESARTIVHSVVSEVTTDDIKVFMPQPGPGATNTPTEKTERYRPHVLYKQIDDVLNYQEWWYATPWHACLRSREFLALHANSVSHPTARFKFVDKVFDKPRGICIEENEMQVMQQCVRKALYKAIQKALYPHIAFDDQSINAYLALLSSIDSKDATIDMSEGSDRVSRELVSWLFQDNEELHNILMALSTKYVVPPSELAEEFPKPLLTQKYAPMGSALCFPVMSLVHYALCKAIIEHGTYNELDTSHELENRVAVYGDDIIVPSCTTDDIFHWLPKFGMKLNTNKSFYLGQFRESCGIHAYQGRIVTPVYVKYELFHSNADAMASALANEAQLNKKHCTETASLVRQQIKEQFDITQIVPDGLSLAGITRPSTPDLLRRFKTSQRRKWSKRYQCWKYKVTRIQKQTVLKEFTSDDDAYLRWLWVHARNDGPTGQPFGLGVVGDSSGSLSKVTTTVLESALSEARLERILDQARRRFPIGRLCNKRDAVIAHKVVLRQCGSLQQQGEGNFTCFC